MSKKRKSFKEQREEGIKTKVMEALQKAGKIPMNHKQISVTIGMTKTQDRKTIQKVLNDLAQAGEIDEVARGRYLLNPNKEFFTGIMDITSSGMGYVIVEGLEEDIFIKNKNLNKALDGDTVRVLQFSKKGKGKSEGKVVEVIERKRTEFVGQIDIHENFAFVRTSDQNMYTDVFVPKGKTMNAKNGQVVLVSFDDWPENAESPFGTVTKILGYPGKHETEIHAILAEYGLPATFPKEVENFANRIDTQISEAEIKKRKDLRDLLTFTIDPADAKDFDDALSYRILENGNTEIGIHIADVSHYVKPGSILDEEAFTRATSVYLVDRVVPMLPEVLSNQACSLRPNEDKYTFSVLFELDKNAKIINEWFGKTVTRSNARLAYEEAQHVIENAKENEDCTIPKRLAIGNKEYQLPRDIVNAILSMDKLAKILRKKRMNHGAISFDKIEVKFILDEENEPTGVYFTESKDANKLIEEFMLLTNKRVSEFIGKANPKKTFIYRIHDKPNSDKLEALQAIIGRFGYRINTQDSGMLSKSLNKLLEDVHGKKEQNLIDTLTIRTMSKATYTTQNIGHYGLAFDYYSHFTSPIRRYPDIIAHRLLMHYLENGDSVKEGDIEEMASHCSEMEVLAVNAERDSIKYMQVKYMKDHEEEEFLGVISGVTEWGVYVEIIENKCEGMVRLQDIPGDFYVFNKDDYAVQGRRTRYTYQLGDEVIVRVKQADLVRKHLDFILLGHNS